MGLQKPVLHNTQAQFGRKTPEGAVIGPSSYKPDSVQAPMGPWAAIHLG